MKTLAARALEDLLSYFLLVISSVHALLKEAKVRAYWVEFPLNVFVEKRGGSAEERDLIRALSGLCLKVPNYGYSPYSSCRPSMSPFSREIFNVLPGSDWWYIVRWA